MRKISFSRSLLFIVLHIPLAYLMSTSAMAATAHAYLSLLVGFYVVMKRKYQDAALVAAYIVGSEVLWRMTGAKIFWEGGKYALILILLIAVVKDAKKIPRLALLYFALLLPSCYLSLMAGVPLSRIPKLLSFNLSGPLSLMMSIWYFWRERLDVNDYCRMAVRLFAPLLGIAFLCFSGIRSHPEMVWLNGSMFQASGGFGPNQVSGILGFGALLAYIVFLLFRGKKSICFLATILVVLFLVQSALTFSRSGIYFALISIVTGSVFLINNKQTLMRLVFAIFLFSAAAYFILPRLDAMTGGKLTERFMNTEPSGRQEIMLSDLKSWKESIVFGIGPGMGTVHGREIAGETVYAAAHTEFSRLLGEHGLFGLFSLLFLGIMFWKRLSSGLSPMDKSIVAALGIFTGLYFSASAMRTALPGFTFGLMLVHIVFDEKNKSERLDN
jgi:hypothetical protein